MSTVEVEISADEWYPVYEARLPHSGIPGLDDRRTVDRKTWDYWSKVQREFANIQNEMRATLYAGWEHKP